MTIETPSAIYQPAEDMSRLVRITNAHIIDRSGVACAECGWMWPCPTRRMADGTAPLDGPWYGTADE